MCQAIIDIVSKLCNIEYMTGEETKRYELRAHMFKALAHPMRIFMLEKLKDRPWCVCELAVEVGIDKSVASKHLSQLKDAGLVDDEKRGTLVEYHLTAPCVLNLAACAEAAVLENRKRMLGIA
jgi:ArsR family transcriptional regulator